MLSINLRGNLFVVSAPSGVGKTTLVNYVLERVPNLYFSISSTTRFPRPGEVNGKDYHFLTAEQFLEGIRSKRFLEWAVVHGQYYGTDREIVERFLAAGTDVLLDIDVQGARQVRVIYPNAQTIFIIPPSMEILKERLLQRGTESEDQIAGRLAASESEIKNAPWYDFIVVNDVLEEAGEDLIAIIRAVRCHRSGKAVQLRRLLDSLSDPWL